MKTKKANIIHIHGRRWFDRINGNTYHTVEIIIDGEHAHKSVMEYGYERAYMQTAQEWLEANGYLPGIKHHENGGGEPLWQYTERQGMKITDTVDDVLKLDL